MRLQRETPLRAGGFLLILALFIYPWAPVGRFFTSAFCAVTNAVVGAILDDGDPSVRFRPADPSAPDEMAAGEWNTVLSIQRPRDATHLSLPLGIRRLGYVPLATFAALVLVTSVGWRRKVVIFAMGMALLLLRFGFAVALPLARTLGALATGSPGGWVATVLYDALIEPPNLMYAAPLVTWLLMRAVTAPAGRAWDLCCAPTPAHAGKNETCT